MCGGDLEVTGNEKTITCSYCGTSQTVPNVNEEKTLQLYNRATYLLSINEYDKASDIYEKIIADQGEQAEAFWGLCLSKYGIEYVDDPKTRKKVPTCHRTLTNSILKDGDYLKALNLADVIAKKLYEEEATYIDSIQKKILEISKDEDPYDVFICYKESDEKKERTVDSVLAEEIYDALTDKGFRVFFSRISLEDKIGKEYEPYIFAALNSSKVMLVIGTKKEYFVAPWVKNEWRRFLSFSNRDKSKTLIPCYKNMSPYDLPDDFVNLQAQDLGKIGFLQDLVKGIQKIVIKKTSKGIENSEKTLLIANKLAQANAALSKREYDDADQIADEILNIDSKNAKAYLIKFKVECKMYSKNLSTVLIEGKIKFYGNFAKALEYADEELKKELLNFRKKYDDDEKYSQYSDALKIKNGAVLKDQYAEALAIFKKLGDYLDSKKMAEECIKGINSEFEYVFLAANIEKCIKPYMTNDEKAKVLEAVKYLKQKSTDEKLAKLIEECDVSADENAVSLIEREIEQLEKEISDFYNSYEYLNILREYERNKEDIDNRITKLRVSRNERIASLESEKKSIRSQLMELNALLGKCGLFQGKLKKELQSKIAFLEKDYNDVKEQINSFSRKEEFDEINSLEKERRTIDEKFELSLEESKKKNNISEKEIAVANKKIELSSLCSKKNKSKLWNPSPITRYRDKVGYKMLFVTLGRFPQTKVTSYQVIKKLNEIKPNIDGFITLNGLDYFKYDSEYFLMLPIQWRVLNVFKDEVKDRTFLLLLSRNALDYRCLTEKENIKVIEHDDGCLEWENKNTSKPACLFPESDIDEWLNNYFYKIAFNKTEKEMICTALLDNSSSTTPEDSNQFICGKSQHKVFLLSYRSVKNESFADDSASKYKFEYENCKSIRTDSGTYNSIIYPYFCSYLEVEDDTIDVDDYFANWNNQFEAMLNSEHFILRNSDLVSYKSGTYYDDKKWGEILENEYGLFTKYESPCWALRSTLSDGSGNIEVDTAEASIPSVQEGRFFDKPKEMFKSAIRPAIIICFDGAPEEPMECDEEYFDF